MGFGCNAGRESRRWRGSDHSPSQKLRAVLEVLKTDGKFDVNAITERSGQERQTVLMRATNGFGTVMGDTIIGFLISNGANLKASIEQPVTRYDEEKSRNLPTGETRKVDVMTCLFGEFSSIRQMSSEPGDGWRGLVIGEVYAKSLAWLIKKGVPIDGKLDDKTEERAPTVIEEILSLPYPMGAI